MIIYLNQLKKSFSKDLFIFLLLLSPPPPHFYQVETYNFVAIPRLVETIFQKKILSETEADEKSRQLEPRLPSFSSTSSTSSLSLPSPSFSSRGEGGDGGMTKRFGKRSRTVLNLGAKKKRSASVKEAGGGGEGGEGGVKRGSESESAAESEEERGKGKRGGERRRRVYGKRKGKSTRGERRRQSVLRSSKFGGKEVLSIGEEEGEEEEEGRELYDITSSEGGSDSMGSLKSSPRVAISRSGGGGEGGDTMDEMSSDGMWSGGEKEGRERRLKEVEKVGGRKREGKGRREGKEGELFFCDPYITCPGLPKAVVSRAWWEEEEIGGKGKGRGGEPIGLFFIQNLRRLCHFSLWMLGGRGGGVDVGKVLEMLRGVAFPLKSVNFLDFPSYFSCSFLSPFSSSSSVPPSSSLGKLVSPLSSSTPSIPSSLLVSSTSSLPSPQQNHKQLTKYIQQTCLSYKQLCASSQPSSSSSLPPSEGKALLKSSLFSLREPVCFFPFLSFPLSTHLPLSLPLSLRSLAFLILFFSLKKKNITKNYYYKQKIFFSALLQFRKE